LDCEEEEEGGRLDPADDGSYGVAVGLRGAGPNRRNRSVLVVKSGADGEGHAATKKRPKTATNAEQWTRIFSRRSKVE